MVVRFRFAYSEFIACVLHLSIIAGVSCSGQENTPWISQDANKVAAERTPTAGGWTNSVEHWNVLPLAGNSPHAAAPLFGERDTLPTFTRELIQVQWRVHDPIDLYIISPTNATKPPVVLFLYGYPYDTDRFRNDAYCESVVKHGFAAVGFVSALTGQRYHDRPMKEWFVSELPESLGASVHDVQMVLNYLATRDDLDMERVGIYGQGSGGTIAILSAAVDPRIKAIDAIDPWGDWPDWLAESPQIPEQQRATYLSLKFLEGITPFDPVLWLPRLHSRSLRLQQTMFSQVTPATARDRILTSAPPQAQTIQYKGLQEYKEKASAGTKVLDWIQTQLHAATDKN
jgi:hypothetical protein